ncbi:putative cell wall protein [Streptococcus intermedius]|uniref:Cell wall protein n=1 Tax=Streptococcus intermedius TaxID=1338 RepID=A0AAD1C7M4_STRIT|nr:CAP domain-containing protein [Streptococcus intermedius]BAW16736.1 putative cell wall protein [Streptococcus intermedius]
MNRCLRFVTRSVLATAAMIPVLVANDVQAQSYGYGYYNHYQPGYDYWNGYFTHYTNYYNNWGYGYNNWNNYYNNWNYGYNNWGNYYNNWNYSYNNWGRNDYNNGYNRLTTDPNYTYWNGNHYYRMSDGSYRIYRNGQWVPVSNSNNSNNGYNNLLKDRHYRYSNGYHYYVLDNGDYYYYQDGKWVFVKNSTENPTTPTQPETPKPEQPSEEPKPAQPNQPSTPGNSGLVTTDEPSENQIPAYVEKPAEGLEHLPWAPNGQTPKLVYPPGKPGSAALQKDKNYYYDGSTHYYYVPSNAERTGYSPYWKWMGDKWKLHGMTDPNDPALDPKLHKNTDDDEYMYSDKNSSVKLFSTNLVTTAKAGQPLPFQNVEEFKKYVIEKMNPKFVDNAGWDAKVEWKIEDEDIFEQSKQNPWARDYVLIANLKSGVNDKKYSDTEFGYVKFVYRVEATDDTNYIALDKAKEAFAKINEERKKQGLKELIWSDEIYNSQALPKAHSISRQYDSTGFVGRRDEDPSTVVKKWATSGLRELLLSPDATKGAVAAVVNGEGVYYWTFNYQ